MHESLVGTAGAGRGTRDGDAHRAGILAALRGAGRRGWLGPAAGLTPQRNSAQDRVLQIDKLALAVKGAVDRIALPLAATSQALCDARAWTTFGYARVEDYARERIGRTGRWLRDHATLGRSVQRVPVLAGALTGQDGGRPLGKVGALWVGKVAAPDSVDAWIALARAVSVRELKETVRRALHQGRTAPPCDGPIDPADSVEREGSLGNDRDEFQRIKMTLPVPIRSAFDETLRLFRAVNGGESSIVSFIEALVAEAHAGLVPPDVQIAGFRRPCEAEATVEAALADHTALWSRLGDRSDSCAVSALAADSLSRFLDLSRCAGRGDHAELDRQLRSLLDLQDELERRLGDLLRQLSELNAWDQLRFAGLGHYAEQRLGLGRTAVENRVRLARVLRRFPILKQAYRDGALGVESALLVLQVLGATRANPAVERMWVNRAREATVKRLRDEVRVSSQLNARGAADRCSLPLDDAAWHGSLMLRPGETRMRVLALASRAADPGLPVTFLRLTLPESLAPDFLAAVESSRRSLSLAAHSDAGSEAEVLGSARHAARMFSARGLTLPSWVGLLALLEDFVNTWDMPEASPSRRADDVYAREGWRCFAPGCTSRKNLEDHHLQYRSRGGDVKDPGNRICLCAFHHRRGEHGYLARCRGQAPLGVLWRLGREDVGVWFRNERLLDSNQVSKAC